MILSLWGRHLEDLADPHAHRLGRPLRLRQPQKGGTQLGAPVAGVRARFTPFDPRRGPTRQPGPTAVVEGERLPAVVGRALGAELPGAVLGRQDLDGAL